MKLGYVINKDLRFLRENSRTFFGSCHRVRFTVSRRINERLRVWIWEISGDEWSVGYESILVVRNVEICHGMKD